VAYKDKEKQREAVRVAVARHRQGITEGITIDKDKAVKLTKIANALDKEVQGLGGKRENMLDLVRFGGIRMRDVRDRISRGLG
jgi:hypothetical protein